MNDDMKLVLEEIRGLRTDMKAMGVSLREEIAKGDNALREEMKAMEGSLRADMKAMEGSLRADMKAMEGSLRVDMKNMETSLRQEIKDGDNAIRLILENDIQPQIRMIAESHLDLNRKLDEIRGELRKNELLPLRVTLLEKDVRDIKEQLAMSM